MCRLRSAGADTRLFCCQTLPRLLPKPLLFINAKKKRCEVLQDQSLSPARDGQLASLSANMATAVLVPKEEFLPSGQPALPAISRLACIFPIQFSESLQAKPKGKLTLSLDKNPENPPRCSDTPAWGEAPGTTEAITQGSEHKTRTRSRARNYCFCFYSIMLYAKRLK